MNEDSLRKLLEAIRDGKVGIDEAVGSLRDLPYEDLGFARLDHHRALRTGHPEAIFCQGKTPAQVVEIFVRLVERHPRVIGTRADREAARAVESRLPDAKYHPLARMIVVDRSRPGEDGAETTGESRESMTVVICAAGTSDLPIAEEAALTAEVLGSPVTRLWDVGVAGLHRLLEHRVVLADAGAVVAVAGMEGALAGIVAGLVAVPVIAVPTSVGYGANFGGLAPLLTMINACAPGVSVVNIDNGFGAGYAAHLIARVRGR